MRFSLVLRCTPVVVAAWLATACGGSGPTDPAGDLDLSDSVSLQGASTLVFRDQGRLGNVRGDIERLTRTTLERAAAELPLERVTILIDIGTDLVIPEIGFGGRADAGTVRMVFDSGGSLWAMTLESEFPALLAHELHHVARIRAVGFADHLLDALVLEGLADQFSVELFGGPDPIWAVAVQGDDLELWSDRAREQYFNAGYNHNAWFFGTGNPPRWAGYSIGYKLAGDYLRANPTASAGSLYAEGSDRFAAAGRFARR